MSKGWKLRRYAQSLALATLAVLAGCKDGTGPDDGIPDNLRRLMVGDLTNTRTVRVVDLDRGRVMETFRFDASVIDLLPANDQRYAFAVSREANVVRILDGGIWDEGSGGQLRLFMQAPAMLDFGVTGLLPTHSQVNGKWFATFLDGTGEAKLVDATTLGSASPTVVTLASGRVHHGIAVPVEDVALVSTASANGQPASGIDVFSVAGQRITGFTDCLHPHGAAIPSAAVFGCQDGLLILRRDGGNWTSTKIPYPAQYAGMAASEVRARPELPYLIAYLKSTPDQAALARIDPATATFTPIQVPGRGPSQEFAFDPPGRNFLVVGLSGDLHVFTLPGMTLRGTVTGATTAQPDPLPALGVRWASVAAGEKFAYVGDPAAGQVAEIDMQTLQVTRRMNVGSAPGKLVLLGTDRTGHQQVN